MSVPGWGSPQSQKRWWTAKAAYTAARASTDVPWRDLPMGEKQAWWLIVGPQQP
jgi:hypothetical protein